MDYTHDNIYIVKNIYITMKIIDVLTIELHSHI